MSTLDDYFRKIVNRNPSIESDLVEVFRRVNINLAQNSLSLVEIGSAYLDITGEDFPVQGSTMVQMSFIVTVPHIYCFSNSTGTFRFYLMDEAQQQ